MSGFPLDLETLYMLTITHWQTKRHTQKHHDSSRANHKDKRWVVAPFLEIPSPPQYSWNTPPIGQTMKLPTPVSRLYIVTLFI